MIYHQLIGNQNSEYCLLFVHGALCNGQDWQYQIDYFAQDYQLLVPDLPGHGRSQDLANGMPFSYSIPELAASVVDLIKLLKISKPLILIGHSMSVRVVNEIYFLLQQQVKGLVLLDCGYQPILSFDANSIASMSESDFKEWIHDFFEQTFSENTAPEIRKLVLTNVQNTSKVVGQQLFSKIFEYDYYALTKVLQLIKIKTLAIQATLKHDGRRYSISNKPEVENYWLNLLKKNVAQLQIEIVPHAGHFVMLEQPELLNKILKDYICSLSSC